LHVIDQRLIILANFNPMIRLFTAFFTIMLLVQLPASAQQYTVNGNASQDDCHTYTLTQNVTGQSGSVWNNFKIDLTQSFDFTFDVYLGQLETNVEGADGITFVLQPVSTSIGSSGGGLGFQNIAPSIGVTLDTYQNSSPDNDPSYDHIAIQRNGDLNHSSSNNLAGYVPISATSNNVEDGNWHTLKVTWNATTKTLEAYFDGVLRVTVINDMVNTTFSGNPFVFWGFTGSTGGLRNLQRFKTTLSPGIKSLATQNRCINEPITFFDSTVSFAPVVKRYWDFGDFSPIDSVNINPVHTYTAAGDYTVTLRVIGADGCVETQTQQVRIGSKPVAAFTYNDSCVLNTIQFNDASVVSVGTINNWYWDFGNTSNSTLQNPSTSYSTPGIKTIKLAVKSAEGCLSDTLVQPIYIHARPVANFTYTDTCLGGAVQFTDVSTAATGTVSSWNWDFGDGSTSQLQHPNHFFATAGVYNVTLTVTANGAACSSAKTIQINITSKPTAYFKNTSTCQFVPVNFTDSSYTAGGSAITGWWWDLGNGQFSASANPVATYNTTGPVIIKLVVTNASGCKSDTTTRQINISGKPQANFTYNDSCVLNQVQFTDISSAAAGNINNWWWDLGNSTTSVLQNPSVAYATNGYKTIRLAVKSAEGCLSDTLSRPIRIFSRPAVDFTFTDSVCLGSPTYFFDNTSISGADTIRIRNWLFSDSSGGTNALNPVHYFIAPGNQTVTYVASATGNNGCLGLKIKNVFVTDRPKAYFKAGTACQLSPVTLTDSSYTNDGTAVNQWWWQLGNGQFSGLQNPSPVYPATGTDTIKLVVQNSRGCVSDTFTKIITVNEKPVAKPGYAKPLCSNKAHQFLDSSTISNGTIAGWQWLFSNGSASTQQNPLQSFNAGPNSLNLVVTSNAGCKSDTAYLNFITSAKPSVAFTAANGCVNDTIRFAAISTSNINAWIWNYGDGVVGSTQNTAYVYSIAGTYPVTLVVRDTAGCFSDTLKRDIIISGTNANAGIDVLVAPGQPVQLQAGGGVTYTWSPATGLSNPNIANPIAIINQDITYTVTASTPQGCSSTDQVTIFVYKGPDIYVPTAFSPNGDGRNDLFRAIPVGITTFESLSVFNRYGQKIFFTSNAQYGWDGTWQNQKQPQGVYVWMVSGVDFKGERIFKKGTVMLVR
jgi:gliding motility-associated-like protein